MLPLLMFFSPHAASYAIRGACRYADERPPAYAAAVESREMNREHRICRTLRYGGASVARCNICCSMRRKKGAMILRALRRAMLRFPLTPRHCYAAGYACHADTPPR